MLLADEINRTPPKTQAALLEAMQEKTVTVAGKVYRLGGTVHGPGHPEPHRAGGHLSACRKRSWTGSCSSCWWIIRRWRRKSSVVEQHSFAPLDKIQPVLTREEVLRFRSAIAQVPGGAERDRLRRAPGAGHPARRQRQAPDYIKRWIRWGASPRASQHLILAGRARAACQGRFNVACEDVAALAPLVLRHRLIRTFQADAEGKTTDDIIAQLLRDVPRRF